MTNQTSPEHQHIHTILQKCRDESDPQRLVDHLTAVKTYYLAFSIQQNTLLHQLQAGQIVEGELEDRLIQECAGCVGETHQVVKDLHSFLRKYEDDPASDGMGFRVAASRLLHRFEHSLSRANAVASQLDPNIALT